MADVTLTPLPPAEAIAFFRAKGMLETFAWQDAWQEEHRRAFTVAKAKGDVLVDIRNAIDVALSEGRTLGQFTAELRPLLEAKGWWGKQRMVDPLTGKERVVQLGSPRRLQTIFNMNLRVAYRVGRWASFDETEEAFPYIRYNHTPKEHPRLEHKAWGDQPVIRRVRDPWWDTHATPNGFGCECYETQMSQRDLDRAGLRVTVPIRFPPKIYTNPRTGEATSLEGGVSPGWSYNPGRAPLQGVTPQPVAPTPPPAAPPSAGKPLPIDPRPGPAALAADVILDEAVAAFLGRFGLSPAAAKVVADVAGEPVVVGPGLFLDAAGRPAKFSQDQLRAMGASADALMEPDEIRWIWRVGPDGQRKLVRRYIKRIEHDGQVLDVVVDLVDGTWSVASSLEQGFELEAWRTGDLAWPRKPAGN